MTQALTEFPDSLPKGSKGEMCIRDRCYAIDRLVFTSTGYQFGYEMLMFNGFLTFMGLTCLSTVSYTHLDVYKRQDKISENRLISFFCKHK